MKAVSLLSEDRGAMVIIEEVGGVLQCRSYITLESNDDNRTAQPVASAHWPVFDGDLVRLHDMIEENVPLITYRRKHPHATYTISGGRIVFDNEDDEVHFLFSTAGASR